MAGTIQDILQIIKNGVYGKDIRQAIYDGIEMCYNDVITPADKQEIVDARSIGNITYQTLHEAIDTEITDLKQDVSMQLLKKADAVDNQYWYKDSNNHIGYLASNENIRYKRVKLKAGVRYTFTHVYAPFTLFADENGAYISDVHASMAHFPDEPFSNNCTLSIVPNQDCYAYVTRNKTKASGETMLLTGDYIPAEYVEGAYPEMLGGVVPVSQLVNWDKDITDNTFWYKDSNNNIGYLTGNAYSRINPVLLKAGIPYTFTNVYAQFTFISDLNGRYIRDFAISDEAKNVNYTGVYTPTQDVLLHITRYKIHAKTDPNRVYSGDISKITTDISSEKGFTGFYAVSDSVLKSKLDIHVAKDGSGDFSSVVSAVNFANSLQGTGEVNIYVHTGDYDILSELGGATFLSEVENNTSERQGLGIWRDNVNIIGVGDVTLRCELPDSATYNQSARVSTLNMGQYDANIENLIIIGKNCRYAIHDECNNWTRYTRRKVKNVKCIHLGNQTGMWQYPHVLGGGAGGGCVYDFINSQFITDHDDTAWSYHINNELEPCHFNVDGCVGICNSSSGKSFRFSYLGTGNRGRNICNVKCCSGNGIVVTEAETQSSTNNNIDVYINGWETIS